MSEQTLIYPALGPSLPSPSFGLPQEPPSPVQAHEASSPEGDPPVVDHSFSGEPDGLDRHRDLENTSLQDSLSPSPLLPHGRPLGVGAGLRNLGFTCFLNAVLQCFTHTVPLVEGLRNSCHANIACERGKEGFCVLCSLRDHIELSLTCSGGVVSPHRFVENINYISSDFLRYQQEDAHEFQHALLDKLERCCIESKTADEEVLPERNLVDQVFGGRLVSKLRCCECGHCSCTYEPLIDLSLEIEDVDTISAALESFTNVEKIEDSNAKFRCSSCNEEVSMEKQLLLDKAPSIAALHLKRFKSNGFLVEKIDKHVGFPLELDLQPYISGGSNALELKYQLYAVVVHVGLLPTSGHYFSFVRSNSETWYRFDDSEVYGVQEEFVLSQGAYILFYAREGIPWFSSLMENSKSEFSQIMSNISPKSVLENLDGSTTPSSDADISNCCKCIASTHMSVEISPPAYTENRSCDNNSAALPDGFLNAGERNYPDVASVADHDTDEPAANDCFGSLTPSRSPSPASPVTYIQEPSGGNNENPQHDRPRMSCKRQLSKMLEDPERKEAVKYISKRMPSSRGRQLCSAMLGIRSPDILKKKSDKKGIGRLRTGRIPSMLPAHLRSTVG